MICLIQRRTEGWTFFAMMMIATRARERAELNPSRMCNSNGGSGGSGFGIGLHVLGKEQQEPACMFS